MHASLIFRVQQVMPFRVPSQGCSVLADGSLSDIRENGALDVDVPKYPFEDQIGIPPQQARCPLIRRDLRDCPLRLSPTVGCRKQLWEFRETQ